MSDLTEEQPFAEWAIVEMMGHRRVAGYVQEMQIAGQGFLRLDIPAAGDDPGRTQYLSPSSVYALHPVGEATARKAAETWRPEPVSRWELQLPAIEPPQLPLGSDRDYGIDDEGGPF